MSTESAMPVIVNCPLLGEREGAILAAGGESKGAIGLLRNGSMTLHAGFGDLKQVANYRRFVASANRLLTENCDGLRAIAFDLHPSYASTRWSSHALCVRLAGRQPALFATAVQHHHAHIASVMAESNLAGPLIGLACDGAGLGADGAVWGCELLLCQRGEFERIAHLPNFPLVGGDLAALQTWRPAAALLALALGSDWRENLACRAPRVVERIKRVAGAGLPVFEQQRLLHVNSPPSSSLGRVFDAAAFILGLCDRNEWEGQAAVALESAALRCTQWPAPPKLAASWPIALLIQDLAERVSAGESVPVLAAHFHEYVAHALIHAAKEACEAHSINTVALSGGCFKNELLRSRIRSALESIGICVLENRLVSAGDEGLALGQAFVAYWKSIDVGPRFAAQRTGGTANVSCRARASG